jgi:hypothetical protein
MRPRALYVYESGQRAREGPWGDCCGVSANTCPYRRGCIDGSSPPSVISACGRRLEERERTRERERERERDIGTLRVSIRRRSAPRCLRDVTAAGCVICRSQIVKDRRSDRTSWYYRVWIGCCAHRTVCARRECGEGRAEGVQRGENMRKRKRNGKKESERERGGGGGGIYLPPCIFEALTITREM